MWYIPKETLYFWRVRLGCVLATHKTNPETVPEYSLGKDGATKSDKFSEKFQSAFIFLLQLCKGSSHFRGAEEKNCLRRLHSLKSVIWPVYGCKFLNMWSTFWAVTRQQSLKAVVFGKLIDVIKDKTIRDGGITLLFLKVQIQPRLAVLSVL